MNREQLHETLIPKERDLSVVAKTAGTQPEILQFLLEGIESGDVRVRYGCLNTVVLISEKDPKILYPYFDHIEGFLDSDKSVFVLAAIKVLANLASVDTGKKFDAIVDKFFSFVTRPEMTPGANVCKGTSAIVKSKPHLADKISKYLLQVGITEYNTPECKNILTGHAIAAFDKIFDKVSDQEAVMQLVENNLENPWRGTKSKAEAFMKKYAAAPQL